MHITPLILSTWSYKNHLDWAYLETCPRLAFDENAVPTGGLISSMIGTEISEADYDSIRQRVPVDAPELRPVTAAGEATNEIRGSHFKSTELTHNGTAAWESLKARLAENDIIIDDQQVAELAAGFQAQRKVQEILCCNDPQALREELDLKWVQDIESRADREVIAEECYGDLKQKFPAAIACGETFERAITFDPNVVEASCEQP